MCSGRVVPAESSVRESAASNKADSVVEEELAADLRVIKLDAWIQVQEWRSVDACIGFVSS